MHLISLLAWTVNLVAAFVLVVLVFPMFRTDLMRHLTRWMMGAATALAVVLLMTRITRIQMTDMPRGHTLADMPLSQATGIAILFGILAAIGPRPLIAVATVLIVMDVAWILDTSGARVAQSS